MMTLTSSHRLRRLHRGRRLLPRVFTTMAAMLAAVGLTVSLAGCGTTGQSAGESASGSAQSASQSASKTLTVLTKSTSISLDPATSQNLPITTAALVHRRLTTWKITNDGQTHLVPDLATSTGTSSDGGRVWTYTLKKGIRFSTGKQITSRDIKWGLERSFSNSFTGGLSYHKQLLAGASSYHGPFEGKSLKSIETPNDRTIIFHLNTPFADWPWISSLVSFAPVPYGTGRQKSYANVPIASGPYKVESNQAGKQLILTRNPYWNKSTDPVRSGQPNRIVYSMGQDSTLAAQQILQGTGDGSTSTLGEFIPPAQRAQALSRPEQRRLMRTSGDGALEYLAINTRHIRQLDVRKAIMYAISKRDYRTAKGGKVMGGYATTLITPGIAARKAYDMWKVPVDGDTAKAKALLARAGQPHPHLTMIATSDQSEAASAIQHSLSQAGFNVSIRVMDSEVFADVRSNNAGDYDILIGSWQPDFPSAYANLVPLFDSSQIGGGNMNLARYSNPRVDKLLHEATGETTVAKANALWQEADRTIMADVPVVPLIYSRNTFVHGSNVHNFHIGTFPAYPDYLSMTVGDETK